MGPGTIVIFMQYRAKIIEEYEYLCRNMIVSLDMENPTL